MIIFLVLSVFQNVVYFFRKYRLAIFIVYWVIDI